MQARCLERLRRELSRGRASGERYENNLYRDYSTQDESTWQQRYTGRYSYVGAQLRLELELADRRCSPLPRQREACGLSRAAAFVL